MVSLQDACSSLRYSSEGGTEKVAGAGTRLKKALASGGSGGCVWITDAMELWTAPSDALCAEEQEPGP